MQERFPSAKSIYHVDRGALTSCKIAAKKDEFCERKCMESLLKSVFTFCVRMSEDGFAPNLINTFPWKRKSDLTANNSRTKSK